jgi:hypothetical protein
MHDEPLSLLLSRPHESQAQEMVNRGFERCPGTTNLAIQEFCDIVVE